MTNPYAGTANTQSMLPLTPGDIPIIAGDSSMTHISPQVFKNTIAIMTADIGDFISAIAAMGFATTSAVTSAISAALTGYDTIAARNTAIANFITSAALTPYATITAMNAAIAAITPLATVYNNGVTHPIITSTSATGWQPSTTQRTLGQYSIVISVSATAVLLGSLVQGTVVLEVCPTNSTTPSDWVIVASITNGQNLTGSLALSSSQPIGSLLKGTIPPTYYARIRSISNSGAPTFAYVTGQEVLI